MGFLGEKTHLAIGLIGGIVVFTTLVIILICFLCYRQRNRNIINRAVAPTNYTDPSDAITAKRSSTYATPYDQWKSQNGVLSVRHVSQKKSPGYYNVDVQDGLCERVRPPRKGKKGSHREYFNVQVKATKKNQKGSQKEYWDVHVKNDSTEPQTPGSGSGTPQNDGVPIRQESRRKDLPTPYSCIELD
ncbi:uncharacterized protein LOC133186839 [Saccostrea echinata]|uniref:uncharacterized protein LOC133186839 n=1 Tax=Saccostrea echinata TaxID=191078 RepID=UPI002A80A9E3|nr:uncharacterized protein LOC133186839 [Saccostrea echinata]